MTEVPLRGGHFRAPGIDGPLAPGPEGEEGDKKMGGDDTDLEDVLKEETSRGRRPIDTEARRERQRLRRDYLKLIREGDEEDFLNALRALGLPEGSREFEDFRRIWREVRRPRKPPSGRRGA